MYLFCMTREYIESYTKKSEIIIAVITSMHSAIQTTTIYACLTELKLHPAITLLCLGNRSTGYNLPSKVYLWCINLKFWMEVNHWIYSAFNNVFLWICTKNRLMFVNSTLGGSCKMYFRCDQYYILFFARTYCFCIFAVGHLH
jgi:hypothetical protein